MHPCVRTCRKCVGAHFIRSAQDLFALMGARILTKRILTLNYYLISFHLFNVIIANQIMIIINYDDYSTNKWQFSDYSDQFQSGQLCFFWLSFLLQIIAGGISILIARLNANLLLPFLSFWMFSCFSNLSIFSRYLKCTSFIKEIWSCCTIISSSLRSISRICLQLLQTDIRYWSRRSLDGDLCLIDIINTLLDGLISVDKERLSLAGVEIGSSKPNESKQSPLVFQCLNLLEGQGRLDRIKLGWVEIGSSEPK